MRSLIAISESVSFDEAARRIGITEPSLHRSARTLERILRRTLYRRTAQGYTTTPPATELARRFKVAAREIEYGMDEITAERGHFASRIVVGNIPHANVHMLSAAINELLAKFPDASVEVLDGHYDDLLNALRSGSVDHCLWRAAAAGMGVRRRREISVLQPLCGGGAARSSASGAAEDHDLGSRALRLDRAAVGHAAASRLRADFQGA